jgi:hypothetical protein
MKSGLSVKPCTIRFATAWNNRVHRRLKRLQGGMWAVQVCVYDKIVGVAIVGNPAPAWQSLSVLSILRVAVLDGYPNACSMLYGSCSRAARAMGASDLVTYTHEDEPGTSLKAAGFIYHGLTDGGEWNRDGRPRQQALFPEPKKRWFAPWGKRAKEVMEFTDETK